MALFFYQENVMDPFEELRDQTDAFTMAAFSAINWLRVLISLVVWCLGAYLLLLGFRNTVDPFSLWGPVVMIIGAALVLLSPKLSER